MRYGQKRLPWRKPTLAILAFWLPGLLLGQDTSNACVGAPGFNALDFWVGNFKVFVGDEQVGTNRIVKVLQGCAIEEHWVSAAGGRGQSLFYYLPMIREWRQVWVTENATVTGGVKEKRLIERLEDGSVRFQGEIPMEDGAGYLDRTTLTPLPDGRVRQHIEVSTDRGAAWHTTFDAVYVPVGGP